MVSRAVDWAEFFLPNRFIVLALGRKPTKIQAQMAASLDELSTKFDDMAKQLDAFSHMAKQFTGLWEMMRQRSTPSTGWGVGRPPSRRCSVICVTSWRR